MGVGGDDMWEYVWRESYQVLCYNKTFSEIVVGSNKRVLVCLVKEGGGGLTLMLYNKAPLETMRLDWFVAPFNRVLLLCSSRQEGDFALLFPSTGFCFVPLTVCCCFVLQHPNIPPDQ